MVFAGTRCIDDTRSMSRVGYDESMPIVAVPTAAWSAKVRRSGTAQAGDSV